MPASFHLSAAQLVKFPPRRWSRIIGIVKSGMAELSHLLFTNAWGCSVKKGLESASGPHSTFMIGRHNSKID